jgi:hypothetical protein
MSQRFEVLDEDGNVANVVIADAETMALIFPDTPYREQVFEAPEVVPLTWDNAPAEYWWISPGAFRDRFGAAKLAVLMSQNPVAMALREDAADRDYIDLKRADMPQLIAALAGVVPEVTADIQEAIQHAPTTELERFVKGLPQPSE